LPPQHADPAVLDHAASPAPYRVRKPLRDTLSGFYSARLGTQSRVLYRIDESKHAVIVQDIQHRSSAYRRRQARGGHTIGGQMSALHTAI
jgi:mRNA interferase RelE/StbE